MGKEILANDNLEENKAKISALFSDLINQVESERILCLQNIEKWNMTTLEPSFDFHKASKDEILDIQLEHHIKIKEGGIVRWNPEYKKEALNERFKWVLSHVKGVALDLITEIIEKFDETDTLKLVKFISKNIKLHHKLKSSSEGKSYYHKGYRNSVNNLFKNRFDVIWNCNEIFHVFPLMKRKGDPLNYPKFCDYPFVDIDIQQWIDFERAFRIIPVLKESLDFFKTKHNDYIKSKLTPLEQVIFIENLRFAISNFSSFSYESKLSYLNLITKGNNEDEKLQVTALEEIVDMDEDNYSRLEDNHSDWARRLNKISNSSLTNLRGEISNYNRKFIKKENDKEDELLTDEEIKYNEKTSKIKEKTKEKQKKIDTLLKSIE